MPTLSDMRARIADELANDGDITTGQINNAIQTAIKLHERRSFWFNMASSSFNTVNGQEFYTSTNITNLGDIIEFLAVRCTAAGATASLRLMPNGVIDALQNGSKTGKPRMYSRFDNQVRLFPQPDAVYAMPVRYVYKLATLSADADTNAWMTDGEELIREASKRILAIDILNAPELATAFASLEELALQRMMAEFQQRFPFTPVSPPKTQKTEG